jgi:hypothetical protein
VHRDQAELRSLFNGPFLYGVYAAAVRFSVDFTPCGEQCGMETLSIIVSLWTFCLALQLAVEMLDRLFDTHS